MLSLMPFSLGPLYIPVPPSATPFSSHQISTPVLGAGRTYLGALRSHQLLLGPSPHPPGVGSRGGHGLRGRSGF